jgi:ubiquinone/menaquinone biosynthesis C-methylase UbiE
VATTSALAGKKRLQWQNGRPSIEGTVGAFSIDAQGYELLDFQHFVLRRGLGANHQAPLAQPATILDLGCGTGRWVVEMAAEFPQARVVGLDLVPPRDIRPMLRTAGGAGSNISFVEADLLNGLPFPDASFDCAHLRLMYSEIPENRFADVLREMVRVTRAGGWVECIETAAAPYDPSPAYGTVMAWTVEACRRKGLDANIGIRLNGMLRALGLAPVGERVFVPSRKDMPAHLRRMELTQMRAALDYWRDPIVSQGIADTQEYHAVAEAARHELDQDHHANSDVLHIVWGQKPRLSAPGYVH